MCSVQFSSSVSVTRKQWDETFQILAGQSCWEWWASIETPPEFASLLLLAYLALSVIFVHCASLQLASKLHLIQIADLLVPNGRAVSLAAAAPAIQQDWLGTGLFPCKTREVGWTCSFVADVAADGIYFPAAFLLMCHQKISIIDNIFIGMYKPVWWLHIFRIV